MDVGVGIGLHLACCNLLGPKYWAEVNKRPFSCTISHYHSCILFMASRQGDLSASLGIIKRSHIKCMRVVLR